MSRVDADVVGPAGEAGPTRSTSENLPHGSETMVGMEPLTRVEKVGDVHIVTLRGEIDAYTAPALRLELRQLIDDGEASRLVIDLAAVTFLDSSGLGALVGALRRLRERGGALHIVVPQGAASRIFVLTGLDQALNLFEGREDALSAASA